MDALRGIEARTQKTFEQAHSLLSFEEYCRILKDHPRQQLRGSAQTTWDMITSFGDRLLQERVHALAPELVGVEPVLSQISKSLSGFAKQGITSQLLLLHGPNGSAKSSIVAALMKGLEEYSKLPEGAQYTISWVFPTERSTKASLGIQSDRKSSDVSTYARLPDDLLAARIPTDLKDHPILVIAPGERLSFLQELLGKELGLESYNQMPYALRCGEISHQSRLIMDALMINYQGDYRKVLRHVQVERYYLSRKYRRGLVTIEPQMHVDAQYQLVSYNRSLGNLPAALQHTNYFGLHGDLVDGNRGLVEFSDILKRPLDSFKYLLSLCETGAINVGNTIAAFDQVLIGSCNEHQLDAFKEFADFSSFKARIHLIRVPYLLKLSQERRIYQSMLDTARASKPVSPHVDEVLAQFAILTRLKKPNPAAFPSELSALISDLTPMEKMRIYDKDSLPHNITAETRTLLRTHLKTLREEYDQVPFYEGRMGASAREMRDILMEAAHNPDFPCVSPLAIFTSLERLTERGSEYEFLRLESKDGYHEPRAFLHAIEQDYLDTIDREMRDCLGLYDSNQWEEFLKKYIQQVSLLSKGEKQKNPITGLSQDPDTAILRELEAIIEAPKDSTALDTFRGGLLTMLGAWRLDHPKESVEYRLIFPDLWKKIESHFFAGQKETLQKLISVLPLLDHPHEVAPGEAETLELAKRTISELTRRFGYTNSGAKEVMTLLLKKRY